MSEETENEKVRRIAKLNIKLPNPTTMTNILYKYYTI